MNILVLEADENDRIITDTLLKAQKHSLVMVTNAFDMFRILKHQTFDVIFIPLEIEGIDSLKLCRRVRRYSPTCILYGHSSKLQGYDSEILENVGFDGLLKKPTNTYTLTCAVEGAGDRLLHRGMINRLAAHA